jgi:hypothetical protein
VRTGCERTGVARAGGVINGVIRAGGEDWNYRTSVTTGKA